MPANPSISLTRIAIYAVLIFAVLLYLVPLVVMLLTSFKTPEDISTGNLLSWPTVVTGIGWVKAWATVDGYFWNSIKITVPAVLVSTAIGALNGYVLSMWRFRGSQLFFGLLLFGCFLPFQTVLLPASFTLGKMGLASTTTGLVFVHIVYGLAFTTLFFRNYYVSIPDALVKAGTSGWRGFLHDLPHDHSADVDPDHHGLPDLAVHPDLERLPVRCGVLQWRLAADHRGPRTTWSTPAPGSRNTTLIWQRR